jgi:hypothetical protein
MSSKIVIIDAGCASTRRARPATHPRLSGIRESDFAP